MALPAFFVPRSGMSPPDGLFHGDLSRQLDMLLASGASAPDAIFALGHAPALERGPGDTAIWFSSTSGVGASRHARAAAHDALIQLAGQDGYPMPLTLWFNGLRKRVDLGRALAQEPSILLMDEPMAGMNTEEKEDLARFILDVREARRIPVVLVEHDMGVVMDLADRIVVLDFGRKIAEGTPLEVQKNPAVLKAYLGEGNR